MSTVAFKRFRTGSPVPVPVPVRVPVHVLVFVLLLGCQAPGAFAQPASSGAAQRLHANAVASFRDARFSEAYGRLVSLADAGHAPSAELALWMYLNGPTLFGKDWDSTQQQLTAWAQLAGKPAPTMVARSYPPTPAPVARSADPAQARAQAQAQAQARAQAQAQAQSHAAQVARVAQRTRSSGS